MKWQSWLERWRRAPEDQAGDAEPRDRELAELLSRARALPREREPERDLWLGIKNRIEHPETEASALSWHASWRRRAPRLAGVAAGALLLIAATSLTTLWISERSISLDDAAQVRAIANRLRDRDGVSDVHASLLALLEERRNELPPQTVAALEGNLRSIDRAIAEIHVALRQHPDNHALTFLLAETYRREADLLDRLEWWTSVAEEAKS